jgi:hypothetical protein
MNRLELGTAGLSFSAPAKRTGTRQATRVRKTEEA